jgi:molybdenum cofactor biosynthesis enzyme MoaA
LKAGLSEDQFKSIQPKHLNFGLLSKNSCETMSVRCLAAYHNLVFDTDGQVRICCNSSQTLEVEGPLDQALTNPCAAIIQQDLDNGRHHPNCNQCWREERNGDRSYRHSYNEMYPDFDWVPQLKTAHVQWDNTCNLTCVYCGPKFSSSWASLLDVRDGYRSPLQFSDHTLSGLDMITLAGGEPTLSKPNAEILARLLTINPDCEVIVNTNLTQPLDSGVSLLLQKFSRSKIIASFESTQNRFEYIRHRAKWENFSNNLIAVKNQVQTLQANMIFFPLSAGAIDQTLDWAFEHINPAEIYLNDYHGDALTWNRVGKPQLDNMVDKILKYADTAPINLAQELRSKCQQMQSDQTQTNMPWLDNFDKLTNQDHKSIFSELYQ